MKLNNSGQPTPRKRWFPSPGQSRGVAAFGRYAAMRVLIPILLLSIITPCRASDRTKESTLSTSPDGRYDVLVIEQADDDCPFAQIRDKKTKKRFATDAHGYDGRDYINAIWREDSRVVALNFSAGMRSHETVLYFVGDGRVTKITPPDFVQNILGRQGAIKAKLKNSEVSVVKFLPENLCLLFAHVEPDPEENRNKPIADGNFNPTDTTDFDVTLRLNTWEPVGLVAIEPSKGPSIQ